MPYNWNEQAEGNNESLPEGYHRVTCTKTMRFKKDGSEYVSKNEDPQVLIVLENESGESIVQSFTLSDKAAFRLAQFLKASGADVSKMTEQGIEPQNFVDEDFAKAQLNDRSLWVKVTADGKYPKVDYLVEDDLPAHVLKAAGGTVAAGVDDSDIPFSHSAFTF